MSTITVATADLRRALIAVGPHASTDKEDPIIHRVRLTVGPENLTVSATNRYSAGLGLVSIEEHDGELGDVDLSPQDVKEILALFKASKATGEDEIGDTLQLTWDDRDFRITDTSGLFPGKSLSLPRYPLADNFPNIQQLALRYLTKEHGEDVERLGTSGSLMALFKAAAGAYSQSLSLEMTGQNSALIVSCGEAFLGLLMPIRSDEDGQVLMTSWRRAWLRRLEETELAATA